MAMAMAMVVPVRLSPTAIPTTTTTVRWRFPTAPFVSRNWRTATPWATWGAGTSSTPSASRPGSGNATPARSAAFPWRTAAGSPARSCSRRRHHRGPPCRKQRQRQQQRRQQRRPRHLLPRRTGAGIPAGREHQPAHPHHHLHARIRPGEFPGRPHPGAHGIRRRRLRPLRGRCHLPVLPAADLFRRHRGTAAGGLLQHHRSPQFLPGRVPEISVLRGGVVAAAGGRIQHRKRRRQEPKEQLQRLQQRVSCGGQQQRRQQQQQQRQQQQQQRRRRRKFGPRSRCRRSLSSNHLPERPTHRPSEPRTTKSCPKLGQFLHGLVCFLHQRPRPARGSDRLLFQEPERGVRLSRFVVFLGRERQGDPRVGLPHTDRLRGPDFRLQGTARVVGIAGRRLPGPVVVVVVVRGRIVCGCRRRGKPLRHALGRRNRNHLLRSGPRRFFVANRFLPPVCGSPDGRRHRIVRQHERRKPTPKPKRIRRFLLGVLGRKGLQDRREGQPQRPGLPVHPKSEHRWLPLDVRRCELLEVQPPARCLWIRYLRTRRQRPGRLRGRKLREFLLPNEPPRRKRRHRGERDRFHQEHGLFGNRRSVPEVHGGTRRTDERGRFQGLLRVPGNLGGRRLHVAL
mmetsp:Transcript_18038/g.37857  ORF Transcript_18038/g.37857 Transcript_18038/m.37857 type:complete len:623 (-) Transcript_18038:393-2261(-)